MKREDEKRHLEIAEKLLSEQNFLAALIAGATMTVLSAISYGLVVNSWRFAYGFSAVAIGIAIGVSMRYLGRGVESRFSVAAALFTVSGCYLGNLFRSLFYSGMSGATTVFDILGNVSYSELPRRALSYISLIDLVYWSVAVWFAVFLTKRALSREQRLAIRMYEIKK